MHVYEHHKGQDIFDEYYEVFTMRRHPGLAGTKTINTFRDTKDASKFLVTRCASYKPLGCSYIHVNNFL